MTSYPPFPSLDHVGRNIQRTMTLLATSTPQRRHRVRILFYGQSLLREAWAKALAEQVKARFPHADLDLRNLAVGGFSTQSLWRPAEQDVYPFYPDLVVLVVAGDHLKYEQIVAETRRRTTAEVMIVTDPVRWLPTGDRDADAPHMGGYYWSETMAYTHLPNIAAKYGCELADIRSLWKRHLATNGLRPEDLHPAGKHDFNDHGQAFMQHLVNEHLRYDAALPADLWRGLVRTYGAGDEVSFKNGKLTLECEGNRIDLIVANPAPARGLRASVRIDGRRPSTFPELYVFSRPNDLPNIDWPWTVGSCIRITHELPLVLEDWTLRFTEMADDVSDFAFEVSGSVTGPDGGGRGSQRFVSRSGRVIIEPEDWWLKQRFNLCKRRSEVGSTVIWSVRPMFADQYASPATPDPSREYAVTVAQGLTNGPHTLELTVDEGDPQALAAIRVYRPPVR